LRSAYAKTARVQAHRVARPPLAGIAAKQQRPCQALDRCFYWGICVPPTASAVLLGSVRALTSKFYAAGLARCGAAL